jgi:hypothetical protein
VSGKEALPGLDLIQVDRMIHQARPAVDATLCAPMADAGPETAVQKI